MSEGLCLVTGGAGFIGSHLVDALVVAGRPVRIFDDFSTGRESNLARSAHAIEIVRGDLRDEAAVRGAMAGASNVFHLAALASVQGSVDDPQKSYDIIVRGTTHVLEAARAQGVRRVVIASSAAIYGDTNTLPLSESAIPNPLSPYAAHKLETERLCQTYAQQHGLEAVALRFFNVYGPRQRPDSMYAAALPIFSDLLSRNEAPTIFGDGEQTRDFVHVSDVVRANLLASVAPAAVGRVINVASGQVISINDVVETLIALTGATVTPTYAPPKTGDVRESLADITLARTLLDFEPTVTLRDGLAGLVAERRALAAAGE